MFCYTLQEIIRLKETALLLDLLMPENFFLSPPEKLLKICNGIGPDSWNLFWRKSATFLLKEFQEAAMIHDFCYTYSDGREENRLLYDWQFCMNCHTLLQYRYPYRKIWKNGKMLTGYCKLFLSGLLLFFFRKIP